MSNHEVSIRVLQRPHPVSQEPGASSPHFVLEPQFETQTESCSRDRLSENIDCPSPVQSVAKMHDALCNLDGILDK